MAKQLEPKVLKHQQHLKVQKEAEEELWISGEELRTDGSSDEEHQKNYKAHKKLRSRRKFGERKDTTPATSSQELTEEAGKEGNKSEEDIADIPLSWRPKRGSLKLPNLYEGTLDEKRNEILIHDTIYGTKLGSLSCLPVLKPEEINDITIYNEKLIKVMNSIDQLEEDFIESTSQLEVEKHERLKVQEQMCLEIYNEDDFHDKNTALFLKLCHFEEYLKASEENNDKCESIKDLKKKQPVESRYEKNFIRRNIELAATAMSKLPLTDEEKQHLKIILADIDVEDTSEQDTNNDNKLTQNVKENEKIDAQNAFHLSEADKQKLSEINLKLENDFIETQNLRSLSTTEEEENFWKNLVLEETLKEIEKKLATLKKCEDSVTL